MMKGFALPLIVLGLILFLFGLIAVTAPNMTVVTLMLYLSIMLMIVGVALGVVGILFRKSSNIWFINVLIGILFLALGVIILSNNNTAADYYKLFIASWAGLMGASLIVSSFFQKQLQMVLIVNGLMSIGFAAVIYFNPFGTNPNFMVGFYTILLSVMLLYFAFKIMRSKKENINEVS